MDYTQTPARFSRVSGSANVVGLSKDLTTEYTESTEKTLKILCGLCVLRGERFQPTLLATPGCLHVLGVLGDQSLRRPPTRKT